MPREFRKLISSYRINAQIHAITEEPDADLIRYNRKAMDAYQDREWSTVTWQIGKAVENLVAQICDEVYGPDDVPENTGRCLNLMQSDGERPLIQYAGRCLSPAWWLRHQASHDDMPYTVEREDAHFALLCFQMGLDTYVEKYLDTDVRH